jgi:hypothetical protein
MLKFEYAFLPAVAHPPGEQDRESRIRAALGIDRGPLPKIKAEWLRQYRLHLSSKLLFPFFARYNEESAGRAPVVFYVEVFGLADPDETPDVENSGLLCRALKNVREEEVPLVDLEVDEDHPNFQLLEDYWYWIWNWRFDPRI